MTIYAVLLTRCPIHARRFHRFCLRSRNAAVIEMLRGAACCAHVRHRKLRLQGRRVTRPAHLFPKAVKP